MNYKTQYGLSFYLVLIGLFFLLSFLINFFYIRISINWIETKAYVINTTIIEKGYISVKSGYKTEDKYKVDIKYFVNQKEYNSSVITTDKQTEFLVIKYNPKKINEIQIITNVKKGSPWLMNFFGFIIIISGMMMFLKSIIISCVKIIIKKKNCL